MKRFVLFLTMCLDIPPFASPEMKPCCNKMYLYSQQIKLLCTCILVNNYYLENS